jgi:hypothetical protein
MAPVQARFCPKVLTHGEARWVCVARPQLHVRRDGVEQSGRERGGDGTSELPTWYAL